MNTITYRFPLNVARVDYQRTVQGFHVGEVLARRMVISLVRGTESYELPTDNSVVATMYVKKPGSTEPSINACTIDTENGVIIYEVQDEDIETAGTVEMQLRLMAQTNGVPTKVIVSPKFTFEVEESNTDDSASTTTTTYTALEAALAQANEYYNERLTSVTTDDDHVIYFNFADGTSYEVNVINEAIEEEVETVVEEKWAETLETVEGYKDSASTSATNASTSETNAHNSELNASTSETNALSYKNNAYDSSVSAAASALNANGSKVSALASALDAEAWAVGTRNGTDVSSTDPAYQNSAKYWAGVAEGSVTGGNIVLYSAQNKTESEKSVARTNIGAVASNLVGQANGIAPLESDGKLSATRVPEINTGYLSDFNLSNSTDGQALIYENGEWKNKNIVQDLSGLSDTVISSATNGQHLIYSNGKWRNAEASVPNLTDLQDVSVSDLEDGQALVWDSDSEKWVNGDLQVKYALTQPSDFEAVGGDGQVSLSWTNPESIVIGSTTVTEWESTTICRAKRNSSGWWSEPFSIIYTTEDYSETTYVDTNVENGVSYSYIVYANATNGTSTPSAMKNATPERGSTEVTITVEGAKEDTITITDSDGTTVSSVVFDSGATSKNVTLEINEGESYTFTSSVAKDTTSGTSNYSKNIVVSDLTYTSPVPSGYEELEYIESTGTQYIDTGLYITSNIGYKIDFEPTSYPANDNAIWIFGANEATGKVLSLNILNSSGTKKLRTDFSSGIVIDSNLGNCSRSVVEANLLQSNVLKYNGSTISASFSEGNGSAYKITLFAGNNQNTIFRYASMKLYSIEFSDGTNYTRKFIPCRRLSDNAVGMYDIVGNQFYGNSGTGTFGAGITCHARAKVMPDGALYWYGNEVENITLFSADDGTYHGTQTYTKNTNNIYLTVQKYGGAYARTTNLITTDKAKIRLIAHTTQVKASASASRIIGDVTSDVSFNNTYSQYMRLNAVNTAYDTDFDSSISIRNSNGYALVGIASGVSATNATLTIKAVIMTD